MTKKAVLYVCGRQIYDFSPVGIRIKHVYGYLSEVTNLFVIGNLPSNSFNFIQKLIGYVIKRISNLYGVCPFFVMTYKWKIKTVLKKHKIDLVFIHTLPFYNFFLCEFIKKIAPEIKIILDMSDPLTVNINFESMSTRMKASLIRIEKNSLRYIDCLCVLNEQIRDYYQHLENPPQKTIVIEQGTDLNLEKHQINEKDENKMGLIYAGGFYLGKREPFALYEAITDSDIDLQLSLYSHFNQYPIFLPPKSKKIKWFNIIAQEDLYEKYRLSDVVVFIDNSDKYQVPGKLFEILVMQKPVLFIYNNDYSSSLKYVRDIEGIFFSHNNKSEIAHAIEQIWLSKKYLYHRDASKYYWGSILKRLDFMLIED